VPTGFWFVYDKRNVYTFCLSYFGKKGKKKEKEWKVSNIRYIRKKELE
jgi:hypothetical protein